MVIDVSVQCNGGFLPDIILLTPCVTPLGNPSSTMSTTVYRNIGYVRHSLTGINCKSSVVFNQFSNSSQPGSTTGSNELQSSAVENFRFSTIDYSTVAVELAQ